MDKNVRFKFEMDGSTRPEKKGFGSLKTVAVLMVIFGSLSFGATINGQTITNCLVNGQNVSCSGYDRTAVYI